MLIDDIAGRKLLVIGDVMLDHFVTGRVERVSPEAPALVLQVTEERMMLGGAANVAANIATLGGSAALVGVAGQDSAGGHLASLISKYGDAIIDGVVRSDMSQTIEKTRYVAGDRHLLRADRENVGVSDEVVRQIIDAIALHIESCDAIVVSDYDKGIVSRPVVKAAVQAGRKHGIPVIADPKRRSFLIYEGADVITPNVKELEFATGELCNTEQSCERAALEVIALTGSAVLLTRSDRGVAVYRTATPSWNEPAHPVRVRDVSGAGDTILAACAIALATGAELLDAAHVANAAAAVAVSKSGTSCVTRDELNFALMHSPDITALKGKLVAASSAVSAREMWRGQGLQVGFTNGCFDLLHPGHIKLLTGARDTCDRLVVGLNTDASVRRLKGPERPVQTELGRAAVIGALRSVDLVVLFDEDTPIELIARLEPDVLIKGADYTMDRVVGHELVQSWGGHVELIDIAPGYSSTNLVDLAKARSAWAGRTGDP